MSAEPQTALVGTGLATAATVVLGPVLGEYAVILGLGLLGTLVALSENQAMPLKDSFWFVFRGVVFSFIFTGVLTWVLLNTLPQTWGMTPYAVMGIVSFSIGWTSDRWGSIKERITAWIAGLGGTK